MSCLEACQQGKRLIVHEYSAADRNALIQFPVSTLGDTMAPALRLPPFRAVGGEDKLLRQNLEVLEDVLARGFNLELQRCGRPN